jgi:hypothetical protein
MNSSNMPLVGWTAIAGGIISLIGFVSLVIFFVVGEPFGTLNDLLAIPVAFLMLPLVFALYRLNATTHPAVSLTAAIAGMVGFIATAAGSVLLVSGRITFAQSLYTGIGGFGLIGLWVLLNSTVGLKTNHLPTGLAWMGILLGITPSLALLFVPRVEVIARSLESMAGQSAGFQMSPFLIAAFVLGGLSYAVMPAWFILTGRFFVVNQVGTAIKVASA